MSGELREFKPKGEIENEERPEDILDESIFKKKFPLTFEKLLDKKKNLETITSNVKALTFKGLSERLERLEKLMYSLETATFNAETEDDLLNAMIVIRAAYPEGIKRRLLGLPETLKKLDEYAKGKKFRNGVRVGVAESVGVLLPLDFIKVGVANLVNYQTIDCVDPVLAKNGIMRCLDFQRQFFEGEALAVERKYYAKKEEFLVMSESGKLTKEVEDRKKVELGELDRSASKERRTQFVEKLKKENGDVATKIATYAVFAEIFTSGVSPNSLFKMEEGADEEKDALKKILSQVYPGLDEETLNQIIKKGKEIRGNFEKEYKKFGMEDPAIV